MRKLLGLAVITALTAALALPALAGGGSSQPIVNGYYTVAWEMPHAPTGTGENAPWPQTYVAHAGPFDSPQLDYLDGVLPECGWFQVDVYKIDSERDREKLAWLLDKKTLDWPEDRSIYKSSKFVEKGPCETTTTTTQETTTTTSVEDTTTTSVDSSTTTSMESSTTSAPTTTVGGPDTTTSLGTSTSPSVTSPENPETNSTLPLTGGERTSQMIASALSLLSLGALFVLGARKEA